MMTSELQSPPSSCLKSTHRGSSASAKAVSFLDQQDCVLIIMADGTESVDLFACSSVFARFGMKVSLAGFETTCVLNDGIQLVADYSFQQAMRKNWNLVVLLGGMRAVCNLMECEEFHLFLKHHVEERGGMVAAMGASATCLLQEVGYVDKYGPTCWPTSRSQIVIKERNGQVWTAPGLNTAPHLALAVGEFLYGTNRAEQVAECLSLPPLSGSQGSNIEGNTALSLNSLAGDGKAQGNTQYEQEQSRLQNAHSSSAGSSGPRGPQTESCAFTCHVWKPLYKLGWTMYQKDGFNFYHPPGMREGTAASPGTNLFISHAGVVKYLENHSEQKLKILADNYHRALEPTGEDFPITLETHNSDISRAKAVSDKNDLRRRVESPATPGRKRKLEVLQEEHVKEPVEQTTTETFTDRLFEHVVWKRLRAIGWKRRKRKVPKTASIENGHAYTYKPPPKEQAAVRVTTSLDDPNVVLQFLMRDPYWRYQTSSFRIVDLFLSCQRIQKEMIFRCDSPESVERETKRRMPALMTY